MSYDSAGELTQDNNGYDYIYDAWHRLVKEVSPGGSATAAYDYVGFTDTAGTEMAARKGRREISAGVRCRGRCDVLPLVYRLPPHSD